MTAAPFRLSLFGAFALQRPDGSMVLGFGRKARALIAVVAISGAPVERAWLARILWSDRGRDQARASLRQTFYEMRQLLPAEPPLLVITRDTVAIAKPFVLMDTDTREMPADRWHGMTLLSDLDDIDPGFDRWLIEKRARLLNGNAAEADAESLVPPRQAESPTPAPVGRRLVSRRTRWLQASGAIAVIAGAMGVIMLRSPSAGPQPDHVVIIQPLATARNDAPARTLANGLAVAVERDITGSGTPVRIADTGAPFGTVFGTGPAVTLRGNATSSDGKLHANLELVGADGTVIWSGTFERPPAEAAAMIDQLGLQVARELHFAFAFGRNAFVDSDPEAIRLSLAEGDMVGKDFSEATRYSTQLLAREPRFARGWAELAINTVLAAEDLPEQARSNSVASAAVAARRALAIDPHQGLAYYALVESLPGLAHWAERERIVGKGLLADPDSPELNVERADDLAQIGRLQDAVGYARRAYALDHFLPGKVDVLASIEMNLGNIDAARDLVKRGRTMWPDEQWPVALALQLAMYWGDPAEARDLIDADRLPARRALRDADLAFLTWRQTPTATTADAAARVILATARQNGARVDLVDQLAMLGRIDAAYRVADKLPAAEDGDSHWFRGYLAKFRADPRFIPMAARLGIVPIWQTSGLWPDFCADKRCI